MFVNLKILSAADHSRRHSWVPRHNPPDLFVKVKTKRATIRTSTVKGKEPEWKNEQLVITLDKKHPKIEIQLWRVSSSALSFMNHKVGEVKITWEELKRRQDISCPVTLELDHGGHVLVEAYVKEDAGAGEDALKQATAMAKKVLKAPAFVPNMSLDGAVFTGVAVDVAGSTFQVAENALQTIAGNMAGFVQIVDAVSDLHPIASIACGIVTSLVVAINAQSALDQQVLDLIRTMRDANHFLGEFKKMSDITARLQDLVRATLKQTVECSSFIREYCGVGFMSRALRETFKPKALIKIEAFVTEFQRLQGLRAEGTMVQASLVSCRVLDTATLIYQTQVLERLRPIAMDAAGRPECSHNTRIALLQRISEWVMVAVPSEAYSYKNIFWLHGMTGCGKSTIATTVASFFREIHRLGAFLFFNRKTPQTSSPSDVIRTIAWQLSNFDPRIGKAIADAIGQKPGATEGSLASQFDSLLFKPLMSLDNQHGSILSAEGPILIVLDALDECGDPKARAELLTILSQSGKLPQWIRIVMTSRPERDIVLALEHCTHIESLPLDVNDPSNLADVGVYVRDELKRIRMAPKNRHVFKHESLDWPGEAIAVELVQRAAGLFVWASTASSFIDSHDPRARLQALRRGDAVLRPEEALDSLYKTALETVGDWNDPTFVSSFTSVIGAVVVAEEPLTTEVIDYLVGRNKALPSEHTIDSLGCVLTAPADGPIRIIHPSFHDYLVSPTRCENCSWFIDVEDHRRILAESSLKSVVDHLDANSKLIGELWSRTKAKQSLEAGLRHSYRFWIEYLSPIKPDGDIGQLGRNIAMFLSPPRFLDWCKVIDVIWSRFLVLDLAHELIVWVKENLPELSKMDPRIDETAICTVIDALLDRFLESPPPGTPPLPSSASEQLKLAVPAGPVVAASAPSKVGQYASIDATVHGTGMVAMSAPTTGDMPWHLTKPYKGLNAIKKELQPPRNPPPKPRLKGRKPARKPSLPAEAPI
ncbi:hypothetical protein EIP91_010063 [Steccherinum ochraceum]|uniref:Uncharacterized protein n=1 Tax=Steccherinum ochraceum TaxID=92696 RepID=A0A4R0R368_9APHY|nr:hypothetical protein EIP91_010063 [Steccherinum ochraceum]